jgi:hypothetical protein
MAEEDFHEISVAETYRDIRLFAGQTSDRLAEARAQIDEVIAMSDVRRLAAFAVDPSHAPEARLLAKNKALAAREARQRVLFDVNHLEAATIGIGRRETVLGRLIGWRQAEWWPEAWRPPG